MYHAAAELADLGVGGDGGSALDAAGRAFQRRALTEAPAQMKHTAEAVQLETMRCLRGLVLNDAPQQYSDGVPSENLLPVGETPA